MSKKEKPITKTKKKVSGTRLFICGLAFFLGTLLVVVPLTLVAAGVAFTTSFYISLIILIVLDLTCGIFIANSEVSVDFKVSWLTVLLCLPYAGAFLYILFAQKVTTGRLKRRRINKINIQLMKGADDTRNTLDKLKSESQDAYFISRYIYRSAFSGVYQNTTCEYFKFGELGFPKMVEELKKAKKFIFIEYFIIERGEFFDTIYDILKEKVKEGVDVRFIYDDFGAVTKVDSKFYKKVREDGIKCFVFNKVRPFVDIRQNSRDHRKILVIDGCVGFTGGCNLADEYINKVVRFGKWKDNIIMLKGEGVNGLTNTFLTSWALNNNFKNDDDPKDYHFECNKELHPEIILKNDGYYQPFGETPFDGENTCRDVYLSLINRAKQYCYISTPYLIPDNEILTALINAAKSGVDVRIITPGIPDKKVVFSATRSYYAKLLSNGVKIYEYTPGFNHTKMIAVDDELAMTGTCNLDLRSMYLQFENCVFIAKSSAIKGMKEDFDEMIAEGTSQSATKYLNMPLYKRIYWALLRVLVPLF